MYLLDITVVIYDYIDTWRNLNRNGLQFQSTWVHPRFLVRFIFSFICMFCRSLFVLLLLAIVLSVLLQYTDSDCPFGIFKLFLIVKTNKESNLPRLWLDSTVCMWYTKNSDCCWNGFIECSLSQCEQYFSKLVSEGVSVLFYLKQTNFAIGSNSNR